ncbi:MAG: Smr/MutS family protein [Gammaproteobacteria bacterium]|nr:Smr/MutS family protein [Gammaproteobacteria bacterium]
MDSDKKSLFQEAMKDVKPLQKSNKTQHKKKRIKPTQRKTPDDISHAPKPISTSLSHPWDTSNIRPETTLSFGKTQIQAKQFKSLKQGTIRPEAKLDLHGLYLDEASDTLVQFIDDAREQNMRCILIIHGKGGRFHEPPILKAHVNHWLKQLPEVLAFHSALARDGGHGAVYVLLKRYN